MDHFGKRLFALLLALAVCGSLLPVSAAQQDPRVLTQADYRAADALFTAIDAAEAAPAKRAASQSSKTEAAVALVLASDSYVEGSLVRSGNAFTWWTDSGIRCIYNPRMRQLQQDMTPEKGIDEIVNEPVATKGGTPAGNQVYLIGPYYGYDSDFTNQYKTEARRVAQAMGDTDGYTLYSGAAATIDKVAEAVQSGAVVFFDSHGATDYVNPDNDQDCITGATGSWLCLTSSEGLTDQDYADGAAYDGENAFVDGKVIANHMTKNNPNGLIWMAMCFGMATDTMYRPLREMGAEVVYGYSESVTFAGDYLFEEVFWDEMTQGKTVAESVATMKSTWGEWDWSTKIANHYYYYNGYATVSAAQDGFTAFPWVSSGEDTDHPGKRTATYCGADSLQTVRSTYTLGQIHAPTVPTEPGQILAEAYALGAGETLPYIATLTGVITEVYTPYNSYYGNVTVIMAVPGYETMPVKCYRLSGSGVDQIDVGDTVTVTGIIENYQHTSGDTEVEFQAGCSLVSWSRPGTEEPALPAALTADTRVELELTEDLYVDLAGYDLSGTVVTNGYSIYCKDSTTDGYSCENIGLFTCTDENGAPVVPAYVYADGQANYLTVCRDGAYSFHRFFLGITHMSLDPEVVGLGYKANFSGDEMVMAQLTEQNAFSFRLQLEGYRDVYRYFDREQLVSGETVTLRIRNYDVEHFSEAKLFAQVGIHLQDGVNILLEEVDLTFRWLAEQVNANYTAYTQEQLAQLTALLEQFSVVEGWGLYHLFPSAAVSSYLSLSDTDYRLVFSTTQQVWSNDLLTLINDQYNSTSPIADYAPIRLYAGTLVTVKFPGMTRLEFDCTGIGPKHVTNLISSLEAISGATVELDATTVSVTLSAPVDSLSFEMLAQGRATGLTAYAG